MQARCKPQESNMSKVIQSSSIIKNNTRHTVALFVPLVGRKKWQTARWEIFSHSWSPPNSITDSSCQIRGKMWDPSGGGTLWWTNIWLWKITIFNGKIRKIHYKWPFSVAMLVHQRVPQIPWFIHFPHEFLVLECQEVLAQMVPWRTFSDPKDKNDADDSEWRNASEWRKCLFCDPFHGRNICESSHCWWYTQHHETSIGDGEW